MALTPLVAAALALTVPTAPAWQWPLRPQPAVVQRFEVGPSPWSPGHRGTDLAAAPGAAVRSPAAGVVRFAGVVAGKPVVSVDLGGGLTSSFEPVVGTLRPGTAVAAGQVVGRLSALPGHCAPASCLHWGVRRDGAYVDPLALLSGRRPIVLKPLGAVR
ncbi:murein hydrolase activator EnvC family protein [Spongisporangium articulatum]|uniref:Murein hydrolase activator EnvC family protein n=1 Tax=Spongisporangium articulatum TaxID=3362603 RepID=A0ABW8ANR4_9ACTN